MQKTTILLIITLTTTTITSAATGDIPAWDYNNAGRDWSHSSNVCNGKRQSPIDINLNPTVNCSTRGITVEFTDDDIKTKIDPDHAMKVSGEFATLWLRQGDDTLEYKALQFHMHTPSEHTINGKYYDAEVHIVFEIVSDDKDKTDNTLTVLGFLFDHVTEEENTFFKDWNLSGNMDKEFNMNLDSIKDYVKSETIDEYYNYLGSLTTPKCNEIVNWFVFKNALNISLEQKNLLHSYYKENTNHAGSNGNNREVQDLNGREITSGSLSKCSFVGIYWFSSLFAMIFITLF